MTGTGPPTVSGADAPTAGSLRPGSPTTCRRSRRCCALVEPPPLADRARARSSRPPRPTPTAATRRGGGRSNPSRRSRPRSRAAAAPTASQLPPVAGEGDGDLLIFAAARSAWFTGHPDEDEVDWSSIADTGWRAAEQAAQPAVGAETTAGLPKRVPQANLVPGSPLREERPLRIVRNAASLAENTTGYFRGWRRGQEIGGYAVGGRPGREAAGGWDFSREQEDAATTVTSTARPATAPDRIDAAGRNPWCPGPPGVDGTVDQPAAYAAKHEATLVATAWEGGSRW